MSDIGRRAFLGGLVAAAAAALALPLLRALRRRPARAALPAAAPSDPVRESARIVGRAYLARFPQDADPVRLRCALAGPPLAERVRRDFERGDVVQLDGWVLSRSEARRCALEALLG